MDHDNKSVAAILYGIVFVIGLKLLQLLITRIAPSFSTDHASAVLGLAAITGALVAFLVVGHLFPRFFSKGNSL